MDTIKEESEQRRSKFYNQQLHKIYQDASTAQAKGQSNQVMFTPPIRDKF